MISCVVKNNAEIFVFQVISVFNSRYMNVNRKVEKAYRKQQTFYRIFRGPLNRCVIEGKFSRLTNVDRKGRSEYSRTSDILNKGDPDVTEFGFKRIQGLVKG